MTSYAILIPARIGSTRFPNKPLAMLNGVPLVNRVYNKCTATGIDTYVITDSRKVAHQIPYANVIYTDDAMNGTERCGISLRQEKLKNYTHFINVQGDMPDITEDIILSVKQQLENYNVVTAYTEMPDEMKNDPNSVKLIRTGDRALWFGRGTTGYGDWHIGIYGYTREALEQYPTLDVPIEEELEGLEQLRWLKNGWQIHCSSVQFNGVEINSPEDVELWQTKN